MVKKEIILASETVHKAFSLLF